MRTDDFFAKARAKHMQAEWYAPTRCERRDDSPLCHCHKRWREARGVTTIPTDDLYFPPPDCTACDNELWHDGDGWRCDDCALSWSSSGTVETCFSDVYGDERPCAKHERSFCWTCEQEASQ